MHSPAPVPKATEEEDAVEDDDAGIASMPRRFLFKPLGQLDAGFVGARHLQKLL